MAEKNITISQLAQQPSKFMGEVVNLTGKVTKFFRTEDGAKVYIVLADAENTINCEIKPKILKDSNIPLDNGAIVTISGLLRLVNGQPGITIGKIEMATDFNPLEITNGLGEEMINKIISEIPNFYKYINNENYKQLAKACLTEENLRLLGKLPATLAEQGTYPGGALMETYVVSRMVLQDAMIYMQYENGIYTRGFNWSLMIMCSLLHLYGNIWYYRSFNSTFRKTRRGLNSGYFVILKEEIDKAIKENNISISEDEIALITNVLGGAVTGGCKDIRACSKEGEVVAMAIKSFARMDLMDSEYDRLTRWNKDNHEPEIQEEYAYSDRLGCYIFVGHDVVAAESKGGNADGSE